MIMADTRIVIITKVIIMIVKTRTGYEDWGVELDINRIRRIEIDITIMVGKTIIKLIDI